MKILKCLESKYIFCIEFQMLYLTSPKKRYVIFKKQTFEHLAQPVIVEAL